MAFGPFVQFTPTMSAPISRKRAKASVQGMPVASTPSGGQENEQIVRQSAAFVARSKRFQVQDALAARVGRVFRAGYGTSARVSAATRRACADGAGSVLPVAVHGAGARATASLAAAGAGERVSGIPTAARPATDAGDARAAGVRHEG